MIFPKTVSKLLTRSVVRDFLHFVTFVSFYLKSSLLLYSWFQEIWRQSSIKFDRLRPFLVIHSVLAIIPPFFGVFEFDRVRRSSTDFDQVRLSLFRVFELSCFRDWFSSLSRGKRDYQEDHENTKVRKHEKMQPQLCERSPDPAPTSQGTNPKQRAPTVRRRVNRIKFIPKCQRSIVVVRLWFR